MSIMITTTDDLPSAPREGFVGIFCDVTDKGIVHFCRTAVLSSRPEIKAQRALDLVVEKIPENEGEVVVELHATNTDLPLVIVTTTIQLAAEGYTDLHVGRHIRVWLSQGFG